MDKHDSNNNCPSANQMLKKIRSDLNLNQYDVAEKMGMLYDTYSKKERCGNITFDFAIKFSKVLGVDPYLFAQVLGDGENKDSKANEKILITPPEAATVLTVRDSSNIEEILYGNTQKPKEEPKPQNEEPKSKKSKGIVYELNATEQGVINTFRRLSPDKRQEVFDFMNKIK